MQLLGKVGQDSVMRQVERKKSSNSISLVANEMWWPGESEVYQLWTTSVKRQHGTEYQCYGQAAETWHTSGWKGVLNWCGRESSFRWCTDKNNCNWQTMIIIAGNIFGWPDKREGMDFIIFLWSLFGVSFPNHVYSLQFLSTRIKIYIPPNKEQLKTRWCHWKILPST